MASSAIANRSPTARTGLAYGDNVTIGAPTTQSARDRATGDRAHRACGAARFPAAPPTPPRRRSPRPAAADRYFQPAAWGERYRRNQYGGCSTKRDNLSLDRVNFPGSSARLAVLLLNTRRTRRRVIGSASSQPKPARRVGSSRIADILRLTGRDTPASNHLLRKHFHEPADRHAGSCRRWSSVGS